MTTQISPSMLDANSLAMIRDHNRLINGDMRIDQRQGGSSITVTSGSVFPVDRWRAGMSGANWTVNQSLALTGGFSAEIS